MTTTPPAIQKILSDPNFLKLSGDDQVAVLKHLQESAAPTDVMHAAAGQIAPAGSRINPRTGLPMSEVNPSGSLATEPAIREGLPTIGAMIAPELLPEMGGGGILGFLSRIGIRSMATGAGAGTGNVASQTISGINPTSSEAMKETAKLALFTSAISAPLEFLGGLAKTKFGRASINQSLGAQTRDVTYGNPAKFLTDNGITDIATGDYEAYKAALREGKSPEEAAASAGGRFAAVAQRVNEFGQRLDKSLQGLPSSIPVKNVIEKPLDNAMIDIIDNGAMGDSAKVQAFNQLWELKQAMLQKVPGPTATPAELQSLKQQLGNRINWQGSVAVTDEVRPAYRHVYGSIKNAINGAAPDAAALNEQLTNGLAAMSDLDTLARAEEVSRGSGITRGKIGSSVMGTIEGALGRVLPATSQVPPAAPVGATIAEQLQSKGIPQPQPNSPALPFKPGAGIPKPKPQP